MGGIGAGLVDRRQLLRIGSLAAAGLTLPALARSADRPDAIVSQGGDPGTLPSIAAAIAAATARSGAFTIRIEPGLYQEKLRIERPDLTSSARAPGR